MEFDSSGVSVWDRVHPHYGLTLAIIRREAEQLIFGQSESCELDQVMFLARSGKTEPALKRIGTLESRIDELSPRFKYNMARSYAQCWTHLRKDAEIAPEEVIRIRDRAIELLEQLRVEGRLDATNAHLALDLRPLIDEPAFLEFCRRLNPQFETR